MTYVDPWVAFHDMVDADCIWKGLTDVDAEIAWRLGLASFLKVRDTYRAKFPHDPTSPTVKDNRPAVSPSSSHLEQALDGLASRERGKVW